MASRSGLVIGVLLLIIVVLAIFLVYAFAIRPAISGYLVDAQDRGVEFAVVSIMQQATTCQTVPLRYGNQTIDLIWTKCVEELLRQQPGLPQ